MLVCRYPVKIDWMPNKNLFKTGFANSFSEKVERITSCRIFSDPKDFHQVSTFIDIITSMECSLVLPRYGQGVFFN